MLLLQGELHSEKMRNKTLRYTLMNMQDDSLSALNKALIPASAARLLPARVHSSSQVSLHPCAAQGMHHGHLLTLTTGSMTSSIICRSPFPRDAFDHT